MTTSTTSTTSTGRGFAGMDRERQREIASQGGRAAHRSGNAHQYTPEEARAAALKGHANAKARADARIAK
jgi:general stress protein YciG